MHLLSLVAIMPCTILPHSHSLVHHIQDLIDTRSRVERPSPEKVLSISHMHHCKVGDIRGIRYPTVTPNSAEEGGIDVVGRPVFGLVLAVPDGVIVPEGEGPAGAAIKISS